MTDPRHPGVAAAIVVDIGCADQGPEHSTDVLIERFHPAIYFGFDPAIEDSIEFRADPNDPVRDTTCIFRRLAAWTRPGMVPFDASGITGGISEGWEQAAACFDLVEFLWTLPGMESQAKVVLKLDCEGAEYPLLAEIKSADLDLRLALVLVEWHPPGTAHGLDVPRWRMPKLRCPVEEWG